MLPVSISQHFDPSVRSRGEECFRSGSVSELYVGKDTIEADVLGTELYLVDISLDRIPGNPMVTLVPGCTCPYFDEYAEPCKHIWATLLAADQSKRLKLPANATLMIDLDPDFDITVPAERIKAVEAALRKKNSAPTWGDLLHTLSSIGPGPNRSPQAGMTPHTFYYVLELPTIRERGKLVLTTHQRKRKKNGDWGKLQRSAFSPDDPLTQPLDRQLLYYLNGTRTPENSGYLRNYYWQSEPSEWTLPVAALIPVLPLLEQTERLLYRASPEEEPVPLAIDHGPTWKLSVEIVPETKGRADQVIAHFRRDGQELHVPDLDLAHDGEPGLIVYQNTIAQAEMGGAFAWIPVLDRAGKLTIPVAERKQFVRQYAELKNPPPLHWPADWPVKEIRDVAPVPHLALSWTERAGTRSAKHVSAAVHFAYGDITFRASDLRTTLLQKDSLRQVHRDHQAEVSRLRQLDALGFEPDPYDPQKYRVSRSGLHDTVTTLISEGWVVLADDKPFRAAGNMKVEASSGIDWFELNGTVQYDGQNVAFPELLKAARSGDAFLRLGDGSLGLLPGEWLARFGSLLELGEAVNGHVRFSRTQISLIDVLLASMPEATFDQELTTARERLHSFEGVKAMPPSDQFCGKLRPYQQEGLGWLDFLNEFSWGGCLADDMGLGKTIQVLAMLDRRRTARNNGAPAAPSLVVVPKSIVFNWMREALAFTPKLAVLDYTGLDRKTRRKAVKNHDLVITTYGTLRRDIDWLRKVEFDYAILDESQAIKNPASQSAKAAQLLQARHRLTMTGTPVENHLGDLWSQLDFLNPGMLGGVEAFRRVFGSSAQRHPDAEHVALLQRLVRPFILRRTKEQVAKELPARTEQTIECDLPAKQRKLYDELRDYYRALLLQRIDRDGLAKSKIHVLEALLRLRQAACHPGLIDEKRKGDDSAKLDTFLAMITEIMDEGHKVLVFSQFTKMLALVRDRLDREKLTYEYLDGRTRDRQARVDRFQSDPNCPLFLISLKAGGCGLNLTAADYVFILDPWWNPAVEAQAIDRTHRIGQTRSVFAYRIIARNTVEQRIIELQQQKRDLSEAIITQANSLIRQLTRNDLEILLS